jgi:hypothetical protein
VSLGSGGALILINIRQAQRGRQALQQLPVGAHLSQQWVRLELPCRPLAGQFWKSAYGSLQALQLVGRAACLFEHRKLGRGEHVHLDDRFPQICARSSQADWLLIVGHKHILMPMLTISLRL